MPLGQCLSNQLGIVWNYSRYIAAQRKDILHIAKYWKYPTIQKFLKYIRLRGTAAFLIISPNAINFFYDSSIAQTAPVS